jgi:hypothetical protein
MANLRPVKYKGLSSLQLCILELATKQDGEVLARDVLIHVFGFKPFRRILMKWPRPGSLVFRRSDIGRARYNSATVSVCKSMNRLARRRLADRIPGGVRLTGINKG